MAKSSGKSYLDKPSSLSPDPFQSRVEVPDIPPAAAEARATSSSIIADLRMRTTSRNAPPAEEVDDIITLDLRDNREELGYAAVKSDYTAPADTHIPSQLTPDPLMAGEPANPQPQPFPTDSVDGGDKEDIKNTELYRRLQEGLSNFEKLVQGETFKREMQRSGVDYRKYSSHLGRAEFGDLKKRSSLGNLVTSGECYVCRKIRLKVMKYFYF